jgi:hypothetical protein
VTIDERIERLQHVTAGWIEQNRKDWEESKAWRRVHDQEVEAIWRRMEQRDEEWRRQFEAEKQEWRRQFAASRTEADERGRELDRRIGDLVAAIGKLIAKGTNE